MSDISPDMTFYCENVAKQVCRASRLKCDMYQYRNDNVNRTYCDLCTNFALEDVEHILLHCPFFTDEREIMLNQISNLENIYKFPVLTPLGNNLHVLLVRVPLGAKPEMMLYFYKLVATNIHHMYTAVLKNREGIG